MLKNKWLRFFVSLIAMLAIGYLIGPNPKTPIYNAVLPPVPANPDALMQYVATQEAQHHIKPNNEARIVWFNDSLHAKTDYAIVYLHGFSASQEEGAPVHKTISKEFGCNLYLSRLAEHGIDTSTDLINITPEKYWESAKEALQIGKQLGNKVILMATSTGGSLALQLAAAYPQEVSALILMSPNIAINNDKAYLLNNPWGLQIARAVTGSDNVTAADERPVYKQYWNHTYPLEATVQLQELLETTMTPETFSKVKAPLLLLYYYKDEVHQDSVVSVPAMLEMYAQVTTPDSLKVKKALPNTGNHVIGSYIKSGDLLHVYLAIKEYMSQQLHIQPVQTNSNIISITELKK